MRSSWSFWAYHALVALPLVAACRGDSGSQVLDRERVTPWLRSPAFAVEVRLRGAVSVEEKPTGIYPFIKMVQLRHPSVALDIRHVGESGAGRTVGDEVIAASNETPPTPEAMGAAAQKMLDASKVTWSADGHVAEIAGLALPRNFMRVVVAPSALGRPSFRFHQGTQPVEALVRTAFGQGFLADSVSKALERSSLVTAFQVLETLPMGIGDQGGMREVAIFAVRTAGSDEAAVRQQLVQLATAAQKSGPVKVRVLFRESLPANPTVAEWWALYAAAIEDYLREVSAP